MLSSATLLPSEGSSPVLEAMRSRVKDGGLAGPDGRRFTLRPAPLVIGRVCDDEPLLWSESAAARLHPDRLLRGLAAAGLLCGADSLALAVDEEQPELLASLDRQTAGSRVALWPVAPRVPLDGLSLCADLAERRGQSLPAAGLDRALVLDALLLLDLARLVEGRPLLYRTVTVAGLVERPAVVSAALGAPLSDLVRACGGSRDPAWVAWHNGPLSGEPVEQDHPVELHTRAVVVLPHRHPALVRRSVPLGDELRRAASACVGCRLCSDSCTAYLAGASLEPHAVIRAAATRWGDPHFVPTATLLPALWCRGCGLCNTACPTGLRPGGVVTAVACRLAQQGVGLAEAGAGPQQLHPDRPGRRLSRDRMLERLALAGFAGQPLVAGPMVLPDRLRVAPRGPGGTPRIPTVRPGESVGVGDLLALAPAGSNDLDCRSPARGTVLGVDADQGISLAVC